jgi:two-component system, LytTR family, sensor kinase
VLGITFSIIVTLFMTADYFFRRMQVSISEAEKLKNEFLQAQLNALKIQLDPHFLFNNFSTLQSLIELNPSLASEFLGKLSTVYRYLTQHREENLVTVQKEMDFVNAYLFLYKIRFGDNFRVEVAIPITIENKLIPPVTLQILIENAVKHNVISSEFPLQIEIQAHEDNILVINNLQPKKPDIASLKSGLSNIISRYELIGNKKPEIIKTETHFTVKIPLL